MADHVPQRDHASRRPERPDRLPADLENLLAETQRAIGKTLAERISLMCGDAFQVGYERGWHEGWDAAETNISADAPAQPAGSEPAGEVEPQPPS